MTSCTLSHLTHIYSLVPAGLVPELGEDGKPVSSTSKEAVTFTAFAVAAGAIALRIGGRAALMSAVGLDFANDNPELKNQLESVIAYSDSVDGSLRIGLFILAWTGIKVFCFDAGGIVLALSSGILFGGVLQGAFVSALGATVGSVVCFSLAKLDTPIRKKALEVVEEYPSLRGIEKVVAKDGFKAILTLRLAPVLPIPLGLYNYVYGVTNVPFLDFCAGIFLGSLKPYLLDSYLGYFGKTVIDGSGAQDGSNIQDFLLLGALGFSVLIGVFASQLAGETWDTVLKEVEEERLAKLAELGEEAVVEDELVRKAFGIELPNWAVQLQIQFRAADERMRDLVDSEIDAKVWNYTKTEIPMEQDPAIDLDSPEVQGFMTGFDLGASVCDGLVLSPILLDLYTKFGDPYYNEEEEIAKRPESRRLYRDMLKKSKDGSLPETSTAGGTDDTDTDELVRIARATLDTIDPAGALPAKLTQDDLLKVVLALKAKTETRLVRLDQLIDDEQKSGGVTGDKDVVKE